jgi:hypothetical protein
VNIHRRHRRGAAALVAGVLLVAACGGGDNSSSEDSSTRAAAEATDTVEVTEYDLVQYSPADRKLITEALDASGVAYEWQGALLTVAVANEGAVESAIEALPEEEEAATVDGAKNRSLKKAFKKATKTVSKGVTSVANDAAQGATAVANTIANQVTSANDQALAAVSKEYRNASGQVVDGLGNVVNLLPTSWPNELGPDALKLVVQEAEKQLNSAMNQLQQQGKNLKTMSAAQAETTVNTLLGNFPVKSPKVPLGGGVNLEFAPVMTPIAVKIQPSQWADANAMNLQLNLSFMGIRAYQVQFGCLGFPNGWTAAPTFTFNGGCHNPWNLMANVNMMQDSAKRIANKAGQQLQSVSNQILSVMTSVAKGADNPRNIPPLVLDLPINEFLGWCCSLGFPSSEASESPGAGNPKKDTDKGANTPDEAEGDSVMAQAFGNMAKDAALAFTIPQLQGINFSLTPDLSVIAVFDEDWTNSGQMEFGIQLGLFGIASATVAMGCVTFGTSWSQTPTFSFEGGCDKAWDVEFSAFGYTTSSKRIDQRLRG